MYIKKSIILITILAILTATLLGCNKEVASIDLKHQNLDTLPRIIGQGILYILDNNWNHENHSGNGRIVYFNGKTYEGYLKEMVPYGNGKLFNTEGQVLYEGEWQDGQPHGIGTFYYHEGKSSFSGEWIEGNPWEGEYKVFDYEKNKIVEGKIYKNIFAISPQFDAASDFSEGLAAVEKDGKYGYIDKAGNWAISPQYDYAYNFSEGLAAVVQNDRYGYIDKRGNWKIEPKFKHRVENIWYEAYPFSEGLAIVRGEDYNYGYIDKSGKWVIKPQFSEAENFSEGLAVVEGQNYKYGYIDKSGNWVIPPKYDYAEGFSEGLGLVGVLSNTLNFNSYDEDLKVGFINKSGNWAIEPIYYGAFAHGGYYRIDGGAKSFSNGLAEVWYNNTFGFIDKKGNLTIENVGKYDLTDPFHEDLAPVYKYINNGYKQGFINKKGELVIDFKFDTFSSLEGIIPVYFKEDLAKVCANDYYGLIDKQGNWLLKPLEFKPSSDMAQLDGYFWGRYWAIGDVSEDLIFISVEDQYGYIDKHALFLRKEVEDAELQLSIESNLYDNQEKMWQFLEEYIRNINKENRNNRDALRVIADDLELLLRNLATININSSNNTIKLLDNSFQKQIKKADDWTNKINQLLKENDIFLHRELLTPTNINVDYIIISQPIIFKIHKNSIISITDVSNISINAGPYVLSLNPEDFKHNFIYGDSIIIELQPMDSYNTIYKISFRDSNRNELETLSNNISLSLPTNILSHNQSVYYESLGLEENIGGQYNAQTNTIKFELKEAGQYRIREITTTFKDIKDKDIEMQIAIESVASKGIIKGRDEYMFEPDAFITRSEFAAAMVKTFYQLDRNLNTTFTDVKRGDWDYDYIASAEKESIIAGYPDKTFRGKEIITKEQIITIAAKALQEKRNYRYPEKYKDYLPFKDASQISDYANNYVALSMMTGMLDGIVGNTLEPQKPMTRGEAAVIMHRLYDMLYNTTALGMQATSSKVINAYSDEYILPESHIRKLLATELEHMDKNTLRIARNEIFARHGYIFKTQELADYFSSKSWYRPNPTYDGSTSEIEKYNIELIKSLE